MGKYFGTDGIRGHVGQSPITPDFVLKLGWAAGKVLAAQGNTRVLIGKDTRISGYMLESALEAGFSAAGVKVAFLGPMPTPAIAYLTSTFRAAAGIVISASHNPYYDNGIKFFSDTGHKLSGEIEAAIEEMIDKPMDCVPSEQLGRASRIHDASGRYIEFCKSIFPSELSLTGRKLVIDCAHGATYHIAPSVFRELGAEVVEIGTQPDGLNINAGCGATDTAALSKAVVEHSAELGLAFDGDGDRLMVVDHQGKLVDGDEIVYILAKNLLDDGELEGGVAGTLMSNMGLELALEKLGVPFIRTAVGDRHVMEGLQERRWALGGENSGHIINLRHHTTGDGILAAIQLMTALVRKGATVREMLAGMEKLPQVLVNVRFQQGTDPLNADNVISAVTEVEKALGKKGRVLLRKSGTEPLIRVMVEGQDAKVVRAYAQQIAQEVEAVSSD
ncbi:MULTISPECIES: phosphoglucosamine mutase [Gammaproteobacteria]|uniref:phosphoglucosamine mutase n=1 Tax=Gammaproteobacteria TaxID=1236 RepID=UPI000DCFFCF0|nr:MULTISPECIES: phosphoglucosamine mutase [Gammaproteobacteria]RTE87474.1 phosphoglucosamine mutase [Aliidiomarina sp. B3213]TCZ93416.1 phosphoglucosamine mutase [Lysobacter sp. N42]